MTESKTLRQRWHEAYTSIKSLDEAVSNFVKREQLALLERLRMEKLDLPKEGAGTAVGREVMKHELGFNTAVDDFNAKLDAEKQRIEREG